MCVGNSSTSSTFDKDLDLDLLWRPYFTRQWYLAFGTSSGRAVIEIFSRRFKFVYGGSTGNSATNVVYIRFQLLKSLIMLIFLSSGDLQTIIEELISIFHKIRFFIKFAFMGFITLQTLFFLSLSLTLPNTKMNNPLKNWTNVILLLI